ncbi:MAG: diguanylate cyclase domain-containing protein [Rubrobacteraceae bacterium]
MIVGEIRDAEAILNEDRANLFEVVFEHAAIGVAIVGLDGRWLKVNRALCETVGYSEQEFTTKTLLEIAHPEDQEECCRQLERTLRGEFRTYQMEKRYFHKLGHVVWILLSVSLVHDSEDVPRFFVVQVQDISERKALEQELTYLASHDHMTDLPNRKAFREQLERALAVADRRWERLAMLFLDLDGFKQVNDSAGHEAGDQVLALAANRLRSSIRDGDTVARFGGDEFCALVEGIRGTDEAVQVAERMRECLREPFVVESRCFPPLTASIGVVIREPGVEESAGQLLRAADAAMYQAKSTGKDGYRVLEKSPALG